MTDQSTIHQIFFNIGKGELNEIPGFNWTHQKTKLYCDQNNIKNILWSRDDVEDLLEDYPEYKELYDNFRYDIQRIDFARLLILYHHGGLYLDLDVQPFEHVNLDEIFEKDFFIARWWTSHLPYNAIISSKPKNKLMLSILKEVERSYEEKSKMKIYETRTARFVFHTTGHYAIHRAIKGKVEYSPVVSVYNPQKKICDCVPDKKALFFDGSASVWYEKKEKEK